MIWKGLVKVYEIDGYVFLVKDVVRIRGPYKKSMSIFFYDGSHIIISNDNKELLTIKSDLVNKMRSIHDPKVYEGKQLDADISYTGINPAEWN